MTPLPASLSGYPSLGLNRIREIREQRAREWVASTYTAAAVARRVGVSPRTFWAWEANKMQPSTRHRRLLARELGVSVEDLNLGPDEALGD